MATVSVVSVVSVLVDGLQEIQSWSRAVGTQLAWGGDTLALASESESESFSDSS